MSPNDFCYWLQGFFEISGAKTLSENELQVVRDHLSVVFEKRTPDRSASSLQQLLTPTGGLKLC